MKVVDNPDAIVDAHRVTQQLIDDAEGRPIGMGALERFAFYDAAAKSFAIVQTSDAGPYGCFIFKKGVI
jgi:L-fucose mutarotase